METSESSKGGGVPLMYGKMNVFSHFSIKFMKPCVFVDSSKREISSAPPDVKTVFKQAFKPAHMDERE
jgi:hypothetical protein